MTILLATSLFAREYIAIIDFEGIGVTEDEAKVLTQRLTSEMITLEVYQVVERSEMKRLLDEQKFQYSGCVDTKCAVEIGKMIGAKYMVVGSVSKLGSSYSIDSRMIDVESSEAYIGATFVYQGQIDVLLTNGISSVARQLCELEDNPQYIQEQKQLPIFEEKMKPIKRSRAVKKPTNYRKFLDENPYEIGVGFGTSVGPAFLNISKDLKISNNFSTFLTLGVSLPYVGIGIRYQQNYNLSGISAVFNVGPSWLSDRDGSNSPAFIFSLMYNYRFSNNNFAVIGLSPFLTKYLVDDGFSSDYTIMVLPVVAITTKF